MSADFKYDVVTKDDYVEAGDLAFGDATEQHQEVLLAANKNELKQSPRVGVGVFQFLEDDDLSDMLRETHKEFVKDGMIVDKVELEGSKVKVFANYGG